MSGTRHKSRKQSRELKVNKTPRKFLEKFSLSWDPSNMFVAQKVLLLLAAFLGTTSANAAKRNPGVSPPSHPGLEFLHLGSFGPVSRLSSHPAFAPLGLSPHQCVGFIGILLDNGFLQPSALRLANGQFLLPPPLPAFDPRLAFGGNYLEPPTHHPSSDPFHLFILSHFPKYLPYGLGPQGIYGSTGLPRPRSV